MSGSLRLCRIAGIDVFVHWSWLLVAFFEIRYRSQEEWNAYSSPIWNVVEYTALFGIVLVHEFGHALACRSVGGKADTIVLWPLGGIAFVQPPQRPGPVLWSIAAGPLVNVLLVPVTIGACVATGGSPLWQADPSDLNKFCWALMWINGSLLFFNMLPIYPLDGGQILQSLLWFVIGQVRSLQVVSVIGVLGGVGLIGLALLMHNILLGVIAAFAIYRCFVGFQQARLLAQILAAPRHTDAACPSCGEAPFRGPFWTCSACRTRFDTFEHAAQCPNCGREFETSACPQCHQRHPIADWYGPSKEWELLPEALPADGDITERETP